jgi:hypothetical protein
MEGFEMREGMVECRECRFWLQSVEEDPNLGPMLADFGLCCQSRSGNWFLRMHKDGCCGYGELKKKEINNH